MPANIRRFDRALKVPVYGVLEPTWFDTNGSEAAIREIARGVLPLSTSNVMLEMKVNAVHRFFNAQQAEKEESGSQHITQNQISAEERAGMMQFLEHDAVLREVLSPVRAIVLQHDTR